MGRLGSFFRKSDDKRSDQGNDNPYAQQSPSDTYSPQAPSTSSFQSYNNNQYSQNQTGLPSGPRPGGYGRNDPNSAPPPYNQTASPNLSYSPYSPSDKKPSPPVGYGNDRFGAQSGYGANRFDNDAASARDKTYPPQRPGGYGGLGGDDNPLFSGYAPEQRGPSYGQPGQDGQYGNIEEMTEEERAEAEVRMKKDEIVGTLNETVSSTKRSRQMLDEATQRMIAMNEQLDRDAVLLNRAEDRLDESYHQGKLASTHLDSLDAANTSIFNFTANSRGKLAERNARSHQSTRDRELAAQELRAEQQQLKREQEAALRAQKPTTLGGRGKADSSKYTFEDSDGEQERLNNEIDDDIDAMGHGVSTLKFMASAMGNELSRQNDQTTRMIGKADHTSERVEKNRRHLKTGYGV